jgi:hypothetical protein
MVDVVVVVVVDVDAIVGAVADVAPDIPCIVTAQRRD